MPRCWLLLTGPIYTLAALSDFSSTATIAAGGVRASANCLSMLRSVSRCNDRYIDLGAGES